MPLILSIVTRPTSPSTREKRVNESFEKPEFFVDGIAAGAITQGPIGDCWFLAALATVSGLPRLLEQVCVARDEPVGVYGFIFFRDGEWISVVVHDQQEKFHGDERLYTSVLQNNSGALYYSRCHEPNETWLPLLEKAYAKIHRDYEAISQGSTGERVEDITGGVSSEYFIKDILDPERFWKEELLQVNKDFLFGCSVITMQSENGAPNNLRHNGLVCNHAYSVLKAVEINGVCLVFIRWDASYAL
ncbi:hypothetical protein BDK51DRAFT_19377 [Blyttiomyces helicus]|uniref:Calpain catalytic domain-containing protein n=1 Tax=Blyttiomyces helicus TaxID=388810 RepID=A0A4P9VWF9_9FUNG|nr:hypothetical protein BDK51DRAFT_19377 [Blyttiomyces helicus]|eukprot:RKO83013.1 hypothetical protein BDK51DRAFT_19377 [Blyttiomyces helicus]